MSCHVHVAIYAKHEIDSGLCKSKTSTTVLAHCQADLVIVL